jgi:hypothetical protein
VVVSSSCSGHLLVLVLGRLWRGLLIALLLICLMVAATSLAGGAMGIVQHAGVERLCLHNGSSVHPGHWRHWEDNGGEGYSQRDHLISDGAAASTSLRTRGT